MLYIAGGTIFAFSITGRYKEQKFLIQTMVFISCFIAITVVAESLFPQLFAASIRNLFLPHIQNALSILAKGGYRSGITIQPAYAGVYIAIAIGIVFSRIKKNSAIGLGIVFLFLLFSELQTAKRMLFAASLISCLVVYLVAAKNPNKKVLAVIKIILLLCAAYAVLETLSRTMVNDLAIARTFNAINDVLSGKNILSQRNDLWSLSLTLFKEHPIFGAGWGGVAALTSSWTTTADSLSSHNSYIQLLAETGLVGTVLYLYPFTTTYFKTIKNMVVLRNRSDDSTDDRYSNCKLAVYMQTFFFIYAMTENPVNEFHMYRLAMHATASLPMASSSLTICAPHVSVSISYLNTLQKVKSCVALSFVRPRLTVS